MVPDKVDRGLSLNDWTCGKDIFDWWVGDSDKTDDRQLSLMQEEE